MPFGLLLLLLHLLQHMYFLILPLVVFVFMALLLYEYCHAHAAVAALMPIPLAPNREDADVRMLGRGRPFAVEFHGCQRDPEYLQEYINAHLLSLEENQQQPQEADQQQQEDDQQQQEADQQQQEDDQQQQEADQQQQGDDQQQREFPTEKEQHFSHKQQRQGQQEQDNNWQVTHQQQQDNEIDSRRRGTWNSRNYNCSSCDSLTAESCCGEQITCKAGISSDHAAAERVALGHIILPSQRAGKISLSSAAAAVPCCKAAGNACRHSSAAAVKCSRDLAGTSSCISASPSSDAIHACVASVASCNVNSISCEKQAESEKQHWKKSYVVDRNKHDFPVAFSYRKKSHMNMCLQKRTEKYNGRCRSADSSNSDNAVCGITSSESYKRRRLNSNRHHNKECPICSAAFGKSDSTAHCSSYEQAENSAEWKCRRLLQLCPFFVSLQETQLSSKEKQRHQVQFLPSQQQGEDLGQHQLEMLQQQQKLQEKQSNQSTVQQQSHQQQQVEREGEKKAFPGSWASVTAEPRDTHREVLQSFFSPTQSEDFITAASGQRLADLLTVYALKDKIASPAQLPDTMFMLSVSPTSDMCCSLSRARQRGIGKKAGPNCNYGIGGDKRLLTASLSDCLALRCPLSSDFPEPQCVLLRRESYLSAEEEEEALIFGAAPAVIVIGMRVVLPQGRQQQMKEKKQQHKWQKQEQLNVMRNSYEKAEREGDAPSLFERNAVFPVKARVLNKGTIQKVSFLTGGAKNTAVRTLTDGHEEKRDVSWRSMKNKYIRMGKEVRLALQHAAEEKIKHYECLVYSQCPITRKQLQDLQLKYPLYATKKPGSPDAHSEDGVVNKTRVDAAADDVVVCNVNASETGTEDIGRTSFGDAIAAVDSRPVSESTDAAQGAAATEKKNKTGILVVSRSAKRVGQTRESNVRGKGDITTRQLQTEGREDVTAMQGGQTEAARGGKRFAVSAAAEQTAIADGGEQGEETGAAEHVDARAATNGNSRKRRGTEAKEREEKTETSRGQLLLFQKTPLRVLHRRSLAERLEREESENEIHKKCMRQVEPKRYYTEEVLLHLNQHLSGRARR